MLVAYDIQSEQFDYRSGKVGAEIPPNLDVWKASHRIRFYHFIIGKGSKLEIKKLPCCIFSIWASSGRLRELSSHHAVPSRDMVRCTGKHLWLASGSGTASLLRSSEVFWSWFIFDLLRPLSGRYTASLLSDFVVFLNKVYPWFTVTAVLAWYSVAAPRFVGFLNKVYPWFTLTAVWTWYSVASSGFIGFLNVFYLWFTVTAVLAWYSVVSPRFVGFLNVVYPWLIEWGPLIYCISYSL